MSIIGTNENMGKRTGNLTVTNKITNKFNDDKQLLVDIDTHNICNTIKMLEIPKTFITKPLYKYNWWPR